VSADERKDEGAGEAAKPVETVDSLTPEDWASIGRDTKRRRQLLARLFAINPNLVQKDLAVQFHVDDETISRDMKIIRAAAGERALDQVAEVGETLEQLASITRDAMADAPQVQVDSTTRAAHRNTALKALDQKVNVLFRLGYWAEAPKRHLLGQDPEADPLRFVLERFSPGQIAEELGNGRFGGGSAGDAGGGVGRDAAPGGGEAPAGEGEV